MKFNQIIIFLNRTCPVNCSTCNAGVNKSSEYLTEEYLKKFRDWLKTFSYPKYVIITGGEPFLNFSSLCSAVKIFNKLNCKIEILTSGVWYKDNPQYLIDLKKYGDFNLRISLDHEHEETVSLNHISYLLLSSVELNINTGFTIREVPESYHNLEYYKKFLKNVIPEIYEKNSDNSRWIHIIPQINLPDKKYQTPVNNAYRKKCFLGFKDIIIGNDGLMYPCCGLFSYKDHKKMSICNPLETNFTALNKIIKNNNLYRDLINKGPFQIGEKFNLTKKLKKNNFSTNCEYCLELLQWDIIDQY